MIYHTTICKHVTTPLHHLPLHLSAKNEEKKENETEQTPVDCIVFPGSGTELSRRSFRRRERRVNSYLIPHLSARTRGVYACCRSRPINFASSSFFSFFFFFFLFFPTFPLEFARNLSGRINYFLLPAPFLCIRPPTLTLIHVHRSPSGDYSVAFVAQFIRWHGGLLYFPVR